VTQCASLRNLLFSKVGAIFKLGDSSASGGWNVNVRIAEHACHGALNLIAPRALRPEHMTGAQANQNRAWAGRPAHANANMSFCGKGTAKMPLTCGTSSVHGFNSYNKCNAAENQHRLLTRPLARVHAQRVAWQLWLHSRPRSTYERANAVCTYIEHLCCFHHSLGTSTFS
jgi:hypothetical protein